MKRIVLFLFTIQCLSFSARCASEDENYLKIPDGFKIGVSTSAYQIEGAWNADDKSPSNWDVSIHSNKTAVADRSNADVATDFYHKYKEDIQLIKKSGFNYFRLSLSWARILPTGYANKVSQAGLQFYKNVLDDLHANGIEPIVTLYHWDHPASLDKMGGWMNELMTDYFVDYARVVFKELGSRVKLWSTMNEPGVFCEFGYGGSSFPPGFNEPEIGPYICSQNVLKAHARAYRMYDQEFRKSQRGRVGIVLSCGFYIPKNESEPESADIAFDYECGWFAHPIFSKNGDYPDVMRKRIGENSKLQNYPRSRLPVLSPFWINYIKGTSDYFGLNHYTSSLTENVPKDPENGWHQDCGVEKSYHDSWEETAASNKRVVPYGFGAALRKIKKEYNNPLVMVMENGRAGYGDEMDLEDVDRVRYLYSYMKEMLLAIHRDGCNVQSYSVWSLLDNFEWSWGYTQLFGLVHVDFTHPNRTRTPRLSLDWLAQVIRSRKLISYEEYALSKHNPRRKLGNV